MKTILLVDDNPQLVVTCGTFLRKNGYNVVEANSGVTGLALARKYLPDLIISDIDMPGGDGATFLREIRHDFELKSTQVVLMTGRPDLVTPRKGMEDGADDFLSKPFGLETLQTCVVARFRRAAINWRVADQMLEQGRSSMPTQLPDQLFMPMAGIIGLMQILRSNLPAFSLAELSDIHNEIYKSALRVQRTFRNYILVLELQTSGFMSPPPPLSSDQVEESIQNGIHEVLRQNTRRKDVGFWMKPCSICVLPENLSRIVEELVDNACKFSRQGTPVKVELSDDGRLLITDHGRGLTTEEINQIGAFQQFDRHKHEQPGLGIGLILVQQLTNLSDAKFRIQSLPGEGTQVEIVFPQS